MHMTLASFGGIVPRVSEHSLSNTSATIAHDVKLRNGRIEAWKEKCDFAEVSPDAQSFHISGCCAVAWEEQVQAADVAPDWGRFYITGRTEYPEVVTLNCKCEPAYTRLGVPAPTTPPVARGVEACGRKSDARTYVYTYVNRWGEEGAPSPASNILTVEDGTTVRVTGISLPPDGYDITHVNIYRATTGFREQDVKQQKPLTDYLYVATIAVPATTFTDDIKMLGLGAALETHKYRTPPKGLRNIAAIGGVVRLAGTTNNRVHMTENFQLHNWPVKYDLTLDSNIVHMGAIDQRLYVTTDTLPYVIDVSSCEDMKCMPVTDAAMPLPDIACKYANAAIATRYGYIYSSPEGLVLLDSQAKATVFTRRWFGVEDWQKIRPDTVRLALWETFLFCVTDEVTFMLNMDTAPFGDMEGSELVTLSDKPIALETSSNDTLFLLEDGKITTWDKGTEYRPYTWRSRELVLNNTQSQGIMKDQTAPEGTMWSPASVKIRTRETEFSLITPLQDPAYRRRVLDERPFRLPRVGRHLWFKVELHGTETVEFVDLGTANFTVNMGA